MLDKNKAAGIVLELKKYYPVAECALNYTGEPWKLLVMAILSAQCTDKRVNIVSDVLFTRYPSLDNISNCDITELENIILPCGLYKTKAKNIKLTSKMLVEKYNSKIPEEIDELLKLPGIGRKIANLIIGDIYLKPAIVTDTHCIRLSKRMGLCGEAEKTPFAIEKKLIELIEPIEQSDFCHRLVLLGREFCSARNPKCNICPVFNICEKNV